MEGDAVQSLQAEVELVEEQLGFLSRKHNEWKNKLGGAETIKRDV